MNNPNYDNHIHTSKFKKFWFCHEDYVIDSVDHELFRSELKFPKSLKDADLKLDSPRIAETIASADYMIIPTKAIPEELPVLQNVVSDLESRNPAKIKFLTRRRK